MLHHICDVAYDENICGPIRLVNVRVQIDQSTIWKARPISTPSMHFSITFIKQYYALHIYRTRNSILKKHLRREIELDYKYFSRKILKVSILCELTCNYLLKG